MTLDTHILQDLGDGLRLRRGQADDADALAEFYVKVFGETGEPTEALGVWTRDLLRRPHPTTGPDDFTIVEDTATGRIVSALCLISQTWTYDRVPFGVGRPEIVATDPAYRRRGLVRLQMDTIHRWSDERGQLAQVITGIPWYYRQFGYAMALNLGGGRIGYAAQVPALPDGASEPYRLRPAIEADLSFLAEQYAQAQQRYALSCPRDEALWRYELEGHSPVGTTQVEIRVIEAADGEAVGFLVHPWRLWDGALVASQYELRPRVSWLAVTPSVVRYLWATAQEYAAREQAPARGFGFWLGVEHPVYQAAQGRLPHTRPPYAYYVRTPDLPAFLTRIAPALEARLAQSIAVGHSGELAISLYRSGVCLTWEQGRLVKVEPFQPGPGNDGDAAFPDLTFLEVLFGHRSLAEVRAAYPDCWTRGDETRALLEALFPPRLSDVWALG